MFLFPNISLRALSQSLFHPFVTLFYLTERAVAFQEVHQNIGELQGDADDY
jgi:hypothetical protein